jgi:hypothetical protein
MIQVCSVRMGVRPVGVYVGRATHRYPANVLGNPFMIGRDGTRAEVIARYRVWLRQQWRHGGAVRQELERLAAQYGREGQLTLLCWCAPLACHADVVREAVLALVKPGQHIIDTCAEIS